MSEGDRAREARLPEHNQGAHDRDKPSDCTRCRIERYVAAEVAERMGALREALALADETFDLMDYRGERAKAIRAPEDAAVGALCERHGYGAVMDSAARLWWLKDEGRGGSFIVGSAACLVEKAAKAVKAALATAGAPGSQEDGP